MRETSASHGFVYNPAKGRRSSPQLPGSTPTDTCGLLFELHVVDHWPRVIVQGHRLPTQKLLGIVQVNLRVLRSRQLGKRVWKGTENKRRQGQKERNPLQTYLNAKPFIQLSFCSSAEKARSPSRSLTPTLPKDGIVNTVEKTGAWGAFHL